MRETLGIDIEGSIIIIDEAHNIEDTCREAGSIDVTVSNLLEIIRDLCVLHSHFDRCGKTKPICFIDTPTAFSSSPARLSAFFF